MSNNHEQPSLGRSEDIELISSTLIGDFITPVELMVRIGSVIFEKPNGLTSEELLDAVIAVTPEVTDHPELEINTTLLESYLVSLKSLGIGIYTDDEGKIRYDAAILES